MSRCGGDGGEHKAGNLHVKDGTRREDGSSARDERDATLPLPDRMLAALPDQPARRPSAPGEDGGRDRILETFPFDRFSGNQ